MGPTVTSNVFTKHWQLVPFVDIPSGIPVLLWQGESDDV